MAFLDELVGLTVTLRGTAADAHRGAVVLGDAGWVVHVEGLAEWGPATGRPVEVTGLLVETPLGPQPVVRDGAVSHGASGTRHVLRGASWRLAA
ncbi:hypothetical protein Lfu02_63860 [Longispora fulva]|uniref:Uncharacterized protein n=1 Tax=Longispora fulva TaxID=619741 RepID=A0A8J7GN60_9ACTN|nr:hypothetical protein [Longispora fulva]MBG6134803.1 hypothetical protein [Longispora fulva]GIG62014.1 hypothetical protein Lfu02_63860 [Longispora fulva]